MALTLCQWATFDGILCFRNRQHGPPIKLFSLPTEVASKDMTLEKNYDEQY